MKLVKTYGAILALLFSVSVMAGDGHEAEGVIKKIKSSDKKLTISHGPIKSLGMSGMTMDFEVYDPAMLDEVKEGHMVSFVLEKDKSNNLVIVEIEDKGMAKNTMSSEHSHDNGHHHDH